MFKINKVIKFLVTSDFFLNSGWGLLSPIFAIFLLQKVTLGNPAKAAEIAGLASLFYWVPKSLLQIPIGKYLDKNHGEKDDFWFMIIGMFIAAFVPIGYLLCKVPWQIYLVQILYAVGMSMYVPSWYAIFTRHIDKQKEAFEWGLDSTTVGFAAGIAGATGGLTVAIFGFYAVFVSVSALTLISMLVLLSIRNKMFSHVPPEQKLYPSKL